jgi:hypothetical protein
LAARLMAAKLTISASKRALELHGPSGFHPQITVATEQHNKALQSSCPDIVVGFENDDKRFVAIHWFGGTAPEVLDADCRAIATGGEGLWRRQPLPVADALWELPPPSTDVVLLVGTPGDARDLAEEKLSAQSLSVRAVTALSLSALRECAVVAFHGPPGKSLHGAAFAALAAGRPLIAPESEPAFGLIAGVDHLSHHNDDELVKAADTALTFTAALEPIVAMGFLAAENRRASVVYERLLVDLRLSEMSDRA